jgi:hypothetical protein
MQVNIRKNKEHGNDCRVHGIFLEGHISSTDSQGVGDGDIVGSLSAGSGLQSVGCIKSVDLDQKNVEVVVVQGREILLSQTTPQIGQLVRLSTTFAGVGDARLGLLHPGQTGKIWHVENEGLVLVQSPASNAKWWYSSESLAIVSSASNGAEDKLEEHAPMKCRDVNPNGIMCRRNHTLSMTSSSTAWTCDVCSTGQAYNPRLRCDTCDFDVCNTCTTKKQVYMRLYSSSLSLSHTHTHSPTYVCWARCSNNFGKRVYKCKDLQKYKDVH